MEINGTTFIARPAEVIMAYISNVENDPNWRYGVTASGMREGDSLDVGSIGFTVAGDTEVEWRIIASSPGQSVDWEFLNGPFQGRGGYRLVPVEGGTQFTLVGEVEPTGLYKLLGPIFKWMGRRRNQADAEKLRDILESTPE